MKKFNKRSLLAKLKENTWINSETGCWEWLGKTNECGYSLMQVNYKRYKVHRLSLYIHSPDFDLDNFKQLSLHKPTCHLKTCWNPEHLYSGTHKDNAKDEIIQGRNVSQRKTHCKRGHEFTAENTGLSGGKRQCRTCKNVLKRKLRAEGRM